LECSLAEPTRLEDRPVWDCCVKFQSSIRHAAGRSALRSVRTILPVSGAAATAADRNHPSQVCRHRDAVGSSLVWFSRVRSPEPPTIVMTGLNVRKCFSREMPRHLSDIQYKHTSSSSWDETSRRGNHPRTKVSDSTSTGSTVPARLRKLYEGKKGGQLAQHGARYASIRQGCRPVRCFARGPGLDTFLVYPLRCCNGRRHARPSCTHSPQDGHGQSILPISYQSGPAAGPPSQMDGDSNLPSACLAWLLLCPDRRGKQWTRTRGPPSKGS
jgi:hypothetical protein